MKKRTITSRVLSAFLAFIFVWAATGSYPVNAENYISDTYEYSDIEFSEEIQMDHLFWIGFVGAIIAGLFAVMQAKKVMAYSEGTDKMKKIAASIREGANAYLKQQYTAVLKVCAVVFAL